MPPSAERSTALPTIRQRTRGSDERTSIVPGRHSLAGVRQRRRARRSAPRFGLLRDRRSTGGRPAKPGVQRAAGGERLRGRGLGRGIAAGGGAVLPASPPAGGGTAIAASARAVRSAGTTASADPVRALACPSASCRGNDGGPIASVSGNGAAICRSSSFLASGSSDGFASRSSTAAICLGSATGGGALTTVTAGGRSTATKMASAVAAPSAGTSQGQGRSCHHARASRAAGGSLRISAPSSAWQ